MAARKKKKDLTGFVKDPVKQHNKTHHQVCIPTELYDRLTELKAEYNIRSYGDTIRALIDHYAETTTT